MSNGLVTPALVLQVVKAGEDLVVTQEEFSSIMGTVSSIVIGVFTFGILGMFIAGLTKKLVEE